MRRNLQMDVLKEYKVVCCHNYLKYNNIQNKFSLLKLCSIVRELISNVKVKCDKILHLYI
jgi:hypothetical protein